MMINSLKRISIYVVIAIALEGCSSLLPTRVVTPPPVLYSLDHAPVLQAPHAATMEAPTLVVSTPHAAAGFDSTRIIYVRQAHTLAYFAQSRWVASPATMLSPLLVSALEHGNAFSAVVVAPTSAAAQLRLDVEIIRLQHEFIMVPSSVHFTLRAYLSDNTTHKVLAWREFDTLVPTSSEDTYGGVVAANQAVHNVLEELTGFCSDVVGSLQKKRYNQ